MSYGLKASARSAVQLCFIATKSLQKCANVCGCRCEPCCGQTHRHRTSVLDPKLKWSLSSNQIRTTMQKTRDSVASCYDVVFISYYILECRGTCSTRDFGVTVFSVAFRKRLPLRLRDNCQRTRIWSQESGFLSRKTGTIVPVDVTRIWTFLHEYQNSNSIFLKMNSRA